MALVNPGRILNAIQTDTPHWQAVVVNMRGDGTRGASAAVRRVVARIQGVTGVH
ncbi:hypothetical protein [Mycolicibacterium chlorophenolicum]|uniref:hypothetical protein n=1 Tax=Mycolicibacterium chlorophenolicum TaxID=37916 RepID=UPI000B110D5F|nr:hypothetical protein [Mycolicibacterium chlorophenolicum]